MLPHQVVWDYNTLTMTWYKEEQKLVVIESDVRGQGAPCRIYNDACDEGVWVKGRTGKEILFVLEKTNYNDEQELTHWDFVAQCRENPESLRHLRMVVFND
tara:strand:- start:4229 stop:4531 length:303 start_codon:yes stop_codon:yes gene_type:complete